MTLYIDTRPQLFWVLGQATTEFGIYDIEHQFDGKFMAVLYNSNEIGDPANTIWLSDRVDTVELAKAAAQADYEERTAERFRPAKEILDLLERASWLVGNPGTNISGSTDLACIKWQGDYEATTKAKEEQQ